MEFAPKQTSEAAGLIIAGEYFATPALEKVGQGNELVLRINGVRKFVQENLPCAIKLRVTVKDGDLCQFGLVAQNGVVTIPNQFPAEKAGGLVPSWGYTV